ncbi:MAG: hypothetical protein KatS3mg095_0025 [Candidatus Parcubacteria bacterium]|nr:MAG: hypothetical protein KatS3mg095_0025 [Candidatus Parcubacteria bacterium]
MKKRSPIVVILGHIDHGKSTLLEAIIQNIRITEKEAGGITQKVNVYEIDYKDEKITFIDTPGHSDFFTLREKGAKIADMAILIIAADEGIKPQTKECLDYIKKFNLPFIVAINKIDKPNANPDKVKKQLSELGILVEEWGGQVPSVNISATKKIGIDDLMDLILLLADILNLNYDENKKGEGYILEATKDNRKGILVLAIVTDGIVNIGDYITTSSSSGKIKFLENIFGKRINTACPSMPIIINGFENLPQAGEIFKIVDKNEINKIKKELYEREIAFKRQIIFDFNSDKPNQTKNLNLVIKTDLIGSLEAIINILERLSKEFKAQIKIIKGDIGEITIEDLRLAKQTDSILIAFNLKLNQSIYEEIKNQDLILIQASVIYEIENKLKDLVETRENKKEHNGELEVLGVFNKLPTKKTIGGRVIYGKIKLNDRVLIIKDGIIVGRGKILSIEKNKIKVNEVNKDDICGLIVRTETDIDLGYKLII